MLSWIIQIGIISFIFIFLVHHIINFLTSTLTVPKIKDLVNTPTKKYENIFNVISGSGSGTGTGTFAETNAKYTSIDLLPSLETNNSSQSMKNELKSFLKKQLNNDVVMGYDSNSFTDVSLL
jgi:hypothetical protein